MKDINKEVIQQASNTGATVEESADASIALAKANKPKTKTKKTNKAYVGMVQMSKGKHWITSKGFKKKANAHKWVDDKKTRGNVIDSKVE